MAEMVDEVSIDEYKKLVEEGKSAVEIGEYFGRSRQWAAKFAKDNGIDTVKPLAEATAKRAVSNAHKRTEIVGRLYDHALRNIARLENIGGDFKTFKNGVEYSLSFIPTDDDMQLMRSITLALKTAVEIEAKSEDSSSKAQSSVGALMDALRSVGKRGI